MPSVDRSRRRLGLKTDTLKTPPAATTIMLATGEIAALNLPEPLSLTLDPGGGGMVFLKHTGQNEKGRYSYDLFHADPVGGQVRQLTRRNAYLFGEQYSLDGRSVTALDDDDGTSPIRVWNIPLDGRPPRQLALQLP